MAKKITFLLVMLFVLLIATVTAFAAEDGSLAPEAGFTQDKAILSKSGISVSALNSKYEDVFFADGVESSKGKELVPIGYTRVYPYNMRHLFFAPIDDFDMDNPYIMLLYIKIDDVYVPLNDIEKKTNITEEVCYLNTTVDLYYLGANKVNKVRAIVFRKNDAENLVLDKNLQITNLNVSFSRWNPVERVIFELKQLIFN